MERVQELKYDRPSATVIRAFLLDGDGQMGTAVVQLLHATLPLATVEH